MPLKRQSFWEGSSLLTKVIATTAAVVVGAVALGVSPAVAFGTGVATFIVSDTVATDPVGVTLTGITPVAQALQYTGVYSDEGINGAINGILNNIDPTFGEKKYFDISKKNGINRVGTTEQMTGGTPENYGFFETLHGMANNAVDKEPVTGYANFVHDKIPKQKEDQAEQQQQQQEPASAYTQEPMDIKGARSTINLANGNKIHSLIAEGQTLP